MAMRRTNLRLDPANPSSIAYFLISSQSWSDLGVLEGMQGGDGFYACSSSEIAPILERRLTKTGDHFVRPNNDSPIVPKTVNSPSVISSTMRS